MTTLLEYSETALARELMRQSPDLYKRLCTDFSDGKAPPLCIERQQCKTSKSDMSTDLTDLSDGRAPPISKGRHQRKTIKDRNEEERRSSSKHSQDGLNKYKVGEKIGVGSVCKVYRARHNDGSLVALKSTHNTSSESVSAMVREFEILQRVDNPNIVKAVEVLCLQDTTMLVMDYFPGLQLQQVVASAPKKRLQETVVRPLLAALQGAVSCLNQLHLVHGDVKPHNVLISSDLKDLRLVDFGSARHVRRAGEAGNRAREPPVPFGTLGRLQIHAAPEVLLGELPCEASDVWQVGLCAHLMLSGRLPQKRDNCVLTREALLPVARLHVSLSGHSWVKVSRLCKGDLQRCLAIDKRERPIASEMFQEWLSVTDGDLNEYVYNKGHAAPSVQQSLLIDGLESLDSTGGERSQQLTFAQRTSSRGSSKQRATFGGEAMRTPTKSSCASGSDIQMRHSQGASKLQHGNLEPSSEVIIKPSGERGTVLVVFSEQGTCKVRSSDGSITNIQMNDLVCLYT